MKTFEIPPGPLGQNVINKAAAEVRLTKKNVALHGYSMPRHTIPKDLVRMFLDMAKHGESRIVLSWPLSPIKCSATFHSRLSYGI